MRRCEEHDVNEWACVIHPRNGTLVHFKRAWPGCRLDFTGGLLHGARDPLETSEQRQEDDVLQPEQDDQLVQCWHFEPGSPCDWDVCRQPERLAAGDRGTDPALRGTNWKERP